MAGIRENAAFLGFQCLFSAFAIGTQKSAWDFSLPPINSKGGNFSKGPRPPRTGTSGTFF